MKALDKIGVPFRVFVEVQEYEQYAKVISPDSLVVLPHQNKGLVATRNYIWDYAQMLSAERFWTFDDNVKGFFRLNRNMKIEVGDGTILRVMEDFVDRYENVPIAGMNYFMFCKRKDKLPPFYRNTRVYSNMLIKTDIPYRNEGFYNDDTDLCLRVLKDGWCTVLFNAFLIYKATTMTVAGGMTPHYQDEGRYKMAEELVRKHPDVARISWKFGRWQHHVDYSPFRRNELRFKPRVNIPEGINDYGMWLEDQLASDKPLDNIHAPL